MNRMGGDRNVDGVHTIASTRQHPMAWCADCPWTRDDGHDGNWLAIRQSARRHARIAGHETRAAIRYVYAYAAEPDQERV